LTGDPVLTLDDGRVLDPAVAGAKAATLARARRANLPVLDGLVIPVAASRTALAEGLRALEQGNSGVARATVTGMRLDPSLEDAVTVAAVSLGDRLVVRSSAPMEADGPWAGAFASYAELAPEEVAIGILGCWASVFAPDPLERMAATGVSPALQGMGVLVQAEIVPDFGGVATVDQAGTVTIVAVAGSPAAIVSGWERGWVIVVDAAGAGPDAALVAIGNARVAAVAALARQVFEAVGSRHIEWAEAEGRLWLLQAQPHMAAGGRRPSGRASSAPRSDGPGLDLAPAELVGRIRREASKREAVGRAGVTQWEPALFGLVQSHGTEALGVPASPGWGAGPLRLIRDADAAERVASRQVIAAVYPLTNLAPLLWDAAGLVTLGGSPGAHLFEVAAWLGVPAVCGVDLETATGLSLSELQTNRTFVGAVDGDGGSVTVLDMGRDG
jgi:pyruvate,water dikinase